MVLPSSNPIPEKPQVLLYVPPHICLICKEVEPLNHFVAVIVPPLPATTPPPAKTNLCLPLIAVTVAKVLMLPQEVFKPLLIDLSYSTVLHLLEMQ